MIEEAFEDFFMVTLPMPFRLRHVNVFLLIHGDELRSEGFLKERRVDGRILYGIAKNTEKKYS